MSHDNSISLEKQKRIFKIIVIGDSSVGKTCLTYRFCGGKFPMKTEATIGVDFRERQVQVDNETVKLSFWDTAGQERFRTGMPPNFYRRVHVAVFVYDITCSESFQNLENWIKDWEMYRTTDIKTQFVLIGNKSDSEIERCVSSAKATHFAKSYGMSFYETSARREEEHPALEKIVLNIANMAIMADPVKEEKQITPTLNGSTQPQKKDDSCC